jgi:hypothetical protein
MKRRADLLCCVLMVAVGCTHQSPSATTLPSAHAFIASPPLPIEVRYDPALHPKALTAQEKAELINAAADSANIGVRAWFVRVRYNDKGIFAADLYFAPDTTTPRIRKGTLAHVEGWGDLLSVVKDGPAEEMPRFVQISRPNEPFDERLTVPEREMMPFEPDHRYFGEAVKLSDNELVSLVDLVRPVFARNDGGPIYRIEMKGDWIRVFSGEQQGPLAGGGRFVDVKRKAGGGFELVNDDVGIWVS